MSKPPSQRLIGIAALVSLIACWGFVPVLLRDLTSSIDAWTANGVRYPFSALLYWPYLYRVYHRRQPSGERVLNRKLLLACLIPALFSTLGQFFWAEAVYHLLASEVGFLIRSTTIVTIVGSMLLFRDERKLLKEPRFYVGVLLAAAGFVAFALFSGKSVTASNSTGLAIILMCSLFFGCYVLSVRKCIPNVDPILAFAIVAQLCSIVLFVCMLLKGDYAALARLNSREWLLIFASSVLGIGIGHVLLYTAIVRLGASITTSCQSMMPFVTAAIASVMLGESLVGYQWMAGVVIVIGALVLLSVKNAVDT